MVDSRQSYADPIYTDNEINSNCCKELCSYGTLERCEKIQFFHSPFLASCNRMGVSIKEEFRPNQIKVQITKNRHAVAVRRISNIATVGLHSLKRPCNVITNKSDQSKY